MHAKLALAAVAIAGTISAATYTQVAVDASTKQPADAASRTVFFDDFSAATLDRSKGNVRLTGMTVNNEQQAYVDAADTLYIAHGDEANGALVIQPR